MTPVARYWFKPKKFGYGATPSTWQGWALGAAYVLALLAASIVLVPFGEPVSLARVAAWVVVAGGLTAATVYIAWRKTEGGWQWRWEKRNAPRSS